MSQYYYVLTIIALICGLTGGWLVLIACIKKPLHICRLNSLTWDINQFCRGWLITGATGSGKTAAGINQLLHQVFMYCSVPGTKWGGVCIDEKGVYVQTLEAMAEHYARKEDLVILEASPDSSQEPAVRFNLIGSPNIQPSAFAAALVKAAETVAGGCDDKGFFRTQAELNIGKAIELIKLTALGQEAAGWELGRRCKVSIDMALHLLTSKAFFDEFIQKNGLKKVQNTRTSEKQKGINGVLLPVYINERQERCLEEYSHAEIRSESLEGVLNHFSAAYWSQPNDQLGGVQSTIMNCLVHYTGRGVREVFCQDSTFNFEDIDEGKIICVKTPQSLRTERRYLCAYFKFLFYGHALRRFDLPQEQLKRKNLIILWQDEAQRFISPVDADVDVIREARATTVVACQSKLSLIPPLGGSEKANVTLLNLRNRIIFRAADEGCAQTSSDYFGKKTQTRKSYTHSKGQVSVSTSKEEVPRVKASELRVLKDFVAFVCAADGAFKKSTLSPKDPSGKVPKWWSRNWF